MENSLRFLGLIRKAGKTETGAESVEAAAAAGRAVMIMSASDASENSVKNAKRAADGAKITHVTLPFAKEQLGEILGRGLPGTVAITDEGFAAAFAEKLASDFPGRYEDAAEKVRVESGPRKRRM